MDPRTPPDAPFPPDRDWKIAAMWDYWSGRWTVLGRMPRRADIDPVDIPRLLPNIWMVDHEADGRFRYRLVGTAVTRAWDGDVTGKFLDDEIPNLARSAVGQALRSVVEKKRPEWRRGEPSWTPAPQDVVGIERLSLPLADANAGVAMVLCLSVYRQRNGDTF